MKLDGGCGNGSPANRRLKLEVPAITILFNYLVLIECLGTLRAGKF